MVHASQTRRLLRAIGWIVWVLVTLSWPVTKWLIALDVLVQLARLAFEQSHLALARATLHFATFSALSWYVTHHRPGSE